MLDALDFPSEFREMYEPFQRLMHRDSVSALPDKLPFAVNILEKKDHYLLTADLPGLNTKNVKVRFFLGAPARPRPRPRPRPLQRLTAFLGIYNR